MVDLRPAAVLVPEPHPPTPLPPGNDPRISYQLASSAISRGSGDPAPYKIYEIYNSHGRAPMYGYR